MPSLSFVVASVAVVTDADEVDYVVVERVAVSVVYVKGDAATTTRRTLIRLFVVF